MKEKKDGLKSWVKPGVAAILIILLMITFVLGLGYLIMSGAEQVGDARRATPDDTVKLILGLLRITGGLLLFLSMIIPVLRNKDSWFTKTIKFIAKKVD